MTIDDVRIKAYLILKSFFPLVCFPLKRDTEKRSIPEELEYQKN